jgi:hypothetical protein
MIFRDLWSTDQKCLSVGSCMAHLPAKTGPAVENLNFTGSKVHA